MRTYMIKRLFLFIPTALGVSVFIFVMLHIIPGDYATALLLGGEEAEAGGYTEEDFERVRQQLGLDGSLPVQYIRWLGDFAKGDLGTSWNDRKPVLKRMLPRMALSFELGFMSVLLSMALGIVTGVIAAVRQDTKVDYFLRGISMALQAMPVFWVALMVIVGLVAAFQWIPSIAM